MTKRYYTVIVGTQPGVYADWYLLADQFTLRYANRPYRAQAAPKVSEVSGAIHKKYKTLAEAREAFNRATHEGTVRRVRVDASPDASSSSSSTSSPRSVARDNPRPFRPRQYAQATQLSREPRHERAVTPPRPHPANRLGSYFHRSRTPTSDTSTSNILPPMHAGQSGLAGTIGHVTVGAEPREGQKSGQGPSKVPTYMHSTERSGSPSSRAADRSPASASSGGCSNGRWQESQQHGSVSVGALPSSPRRQFRDSFGAALLQSPRSGHSSGNVSPPQRRPLSASPLRAGRAGVGSEGSNCHPFALRAPWLTGCMILT